MAEKKSRRSVAPYIVIIILGLIIIALLLYIIPFRYGLNDEVSFEPSDIALDNPLTGYAPWGENEDECEDSQLIYIQLRWSEWEPEEGEYDIEALEEKYDIPRWKQEHKNAVLRFVCDIPDDEEHMDIPAWLYSRTQDGAFYDGKYGKGYCPDYSNRFFRERHKLAIEALAEYCNRDSFVAYVELGSLGHWGEWHTNTESGALPLPDAEICNEYVLHYSDSFKNARLLMRRNYSIAVDGGLGFYNDMAGDEKSTENWLGWMRDGGSYETDGEPLVFTPTERFWDTAPVGGELAGNEEKEDMLGKWFDITLESVESAHMSFIGPRCPTGDLKDTEAAKKLRERLGYRYYISGLKTEYSFSEDGIMLTLTWCNTGLAPLYWDWSAMVYVYDRDGKLTFWETVDIDLRELTPDRKITTVTKIPFTDVFRQGYEVGIGISSPELDRRIKLAMDVPERDSVQIIYRFEND